MHKCSINYADSAPAMEKEGVKQIFSRSISDRKLRYTGYYGGGDSKGFASASASNPSHQKRTYRRVGNRLRKL